MELTVNGVKRKLEANPQMPLLWALRDLLGLTGVKFGCGMSLCGACTVHVDGKAVRSCVTNLADVEGKSITTIEGVEAGHPVKKAWVKCSVPQCGYCQPGQIMSAVALLQSKANPTEQDINESMSGNICRCGTYPRIKQAIQTAAKGETP